MPSKQCNYNRSFTLRWYKFVKIKKKTFYDKPLTMLLLYRKQAWPTQSFAEAVSQLLFDPIDIILGDFNIDAFDMPSSLSLLLQQFSLVVH